MTLHYILIIRYRKYVARNNRVYPAPYRTGLDCQIDMEETSKTQKGGATHMCWVPALRRLR